MSEKEIVGITVTTTMNPEILKDKAMPEITAHTTEGGTWIAVNGEDICFIPNGKNGADGHSPTIDVTEQTDGLVIIVMGMRIIRILFLLVRLELMVKMVSEEQEY